MDARTPDRTSTGGPIFVKVARTKRPHYRKHIGRTGHILCSERRDNLTALTYLVCFAEELAWFQPHELERLYEYGDNGCVYHPFTLPRY